MVRIFAAWKNASQDSVKAAVGSRPPPTFYAKEQLPNTPTSVEGVKEAAAAAAGYLFGVRMAPWIRVPYYHLRGLDHARVRLGCGGYMTADREVQSGARRV